MSKDDLLSLIQKAGLIPVPVIFGEDEEGRSPDFFDGTIESFLVAAKELGNRAVFIQDNALEEDDFLYSPNEEDEDENDLHEIDLASISPALAKFKKHLGKNYSFCLVAKGGIGDLRFIVDQDWVKDFENEWERAEGKFLADQFKAIKN